MTRCLRCQTPCADKDTVCRVCGYPIVRIKPKLWKQEEWWSPVTLWRAFEGTLLLYLIRLGLQPLFMVYQGERNEGRLIFFHVLFGLALSGILGCLRRERGELWLWLILGFWGGLCSWLLDYAYMDQHLGLQAVWYTVGTLRDNYGADTARISFGILSTLRFLGLALVLGIFGAWKSTPMAKGRVLLFLAMALLIDFPLLPYALTLELLPHYPEQTLRFMGSYFLLIYGLGIVDGDLPK